MTSRSFWIENQVISEILVVASCFAIAEGLTRFWDQFSNFFTMDPELEHLVADMYLPSIMAGVWEMLKDMSQVRWMMNQQPLASLLLCCQMARRTGKFQERSTCQDFCFPWLGQGS
jgi:hypothetical protein